MKVLITGASSGIGKAVAEWFLADYDCRVVEVSRRPPTGLSGITPQNGRTWYSWDVTEQPQVFLEKEITLGFDAVVHCAGVSVLEPYGKIREENFKAVLHTNVWGTANLLNLLAKHEENAKKSCRVIVLGSVAAHVPMRMSSAYNASKAAQAMLVRQAAREFGKSMSVIGVQPSYIPGTRMSDYVKNTVKDLRHQTDAEFDDYQLKISPVGRYAEMKEVVECVRWLVEEAPAQALTGQFITPSCGA